MTPQLEKVFFNYILKNKKYFDIVKPYFFRNSEIQFVFGVIRNYILKSTESKVPTPRQILDMVNLEDKEGLITKDMLKSILQVNLDEYSEKDFVLPRFNGWVLRNRIKTGAVDIVDETRNLDEISDFEKIVEAANRIRSIIDETSSTNFIQDDDLGSDFDLPENHVQDSSKFKIKCGFETIDHMLGGGWDISTLNVIMAQTNGGKCFFGDGHIKVRNLEKNQVMEYKIGKIFTEVRKRHNNI
jgi:replicative DNA helicase